MFFISTDELNIVIWSLESESHTLLSVAVVSGDMVVES